MVHLVTICFQDSQPLAVLDAFALVLKPKRHRSSWIILVQERSSGNASYLLLLVREAHCSGKGENLCSPAPAPPWPFPNRRGRRGRLHPRRPLCTCWRHP